MSDSRSLVERVAPRSLIGCLVFTLLSGGFFIAYWLTHVHGQVNEARPAKRLPTLWLWATWAAYLGSRYVSHRPARYGEPPPATITLDIVSIVLALASVGLLVFLELRLRVVLNTALGLSPGTPGRIALVPTLLLGILYLQWKLNRLSRLPVASTSGTAVT